MEKTEAVPMLSVAGGGVLVATGVVAYVITDFASVTALIPAVFGVILVVAGTVGLRTDRERESVYATAVVAAVGALGSTRGVPDKISLLRGDPVETPVAAVSQGVMLGVCVVLVVAAVWYVVKE